MKNYDYTILNKFPVTMIDEIQAFYESNKEDINNDGPYETTVFGNDPNSYNRMEPDHPLVDPIKKTLARFPISMTAIFITAPRYGLADIHTDYIRHAVINIPAKVDLKNSLFMMGNETCNAFPISEDDLNRKRPEVSSDRPPPKRYPYEPEKYSVYNLEKPVLFNPQIPHGFANWSDEERAILSVTLDCTYKEALELLPKEWL